MVSESKTQVEEEKLIEQDQVELISNRGLLFRTKLVQDFKLPDIDELTVQKKTFVNDFQGNFQGNDYLCMRKEDPVYFDSSKLNHTRKLIEQNELDRVDKSKKKRSRLRNRHYKFTPISLWAHWIVRSKMFAAVSVVSILLNATLVVIQLDYRDSLLYENPEVAMALCILETTISIILLLQLLLSWLDNFKEFWSSTWNIIDFIVTGVSVVPTVITNLVPALSLHLATKKVEANGEYIDIMFLSRALVCVKLITRVPQFRLLILSVTKALKSLVMVLLLFSISAFITAIFGVTFFEHYAISQNEALVYNHLFTSVDRLFLLLFRLFTLDGWVDVYKDMKMEVNSVGAAAFVIIWVVFGSYIIGNMYIGILVNNFVQIRQNLVQQAERHKERDIREQAEEITHVSTHKTNQSAEVQKDSCTADKTSTLIASGDHEQTLLKNKEKRTKSSKKSKRTKGVSRKVGKVISKKNITRGDGEPILHTSSSSKSPLVKVNWPNIFSLQWLLNRKNLSAVHPDVMSTLESSLSSGSSGVGEWDGFTENRDFGQNKKIRIASDTQGATEDTERGWTDEVKHKIKKFSSHGLSDGESRLLTPIPTNFHPSAFGKSTEDGGSVVVGDFTNSRIWQRVVHKICDRLEYVDTVTSWNKDVYFQFLILMEHLQENVAERQQLLKTCNLCLLSLTEDFQVDNQLTTHPIKLAEKKKRSANRKRKDKGEKLRELALAGQFVNKWRAFSKVYNKNTPLRTIIYANH